MFTIYWRNRNWQNSTFNILPHWKKLHIYYKCMYAWWWAEIYRIHTWEPHPPKKPHKLYFCKLSFAYYPTFLLITENLILQFKVTQTLPDLRWSVQDPSHFSLLSCSSSSSMDRCIVLESREVASGPMLPSVLPLASAVHLFWSPSWSSGICY